MATASKNRAGQLMSSLRKRASQLVDAEDGMVRTVRGLVEERSWTPTVLTWFSGLQLVTRRDLRQVEDELASLRKAVERLKKQLKSPAAEKV